MQKLIEYTSTEKNYALCRKDLDLIVNGNFQSSGYEECRDMSFFKIKGITRFWKDEQELDVSSLCGDILNSCVRYGVPFAYAIVGDENGISIYVGTMKILREGLVTSFESAYPGIDIDMVGENPLITEECLQESLQTKCRAKRKVTKSKAFVAACRGRSSRIWFLHPVLAI